jgi:sulfite reductase (NADPH) flavoprotein alpha-component
LIQEPTAPHIFARSQLVLDHSTAEIVRWEPYSDANLGRKLRIWVRGLHTGEVLGFVGQTVAGLASLGGCFLVWTGFAMAWRRFRYRKREAGSIAISAATAAPLKAAPAVIQPDTQIDQISTEAKTEMEGTNASLTNGNRHNGHARATDWSTAPFNGDSVLILYGTVTGTAETLANKLATELRSDGVTTRVRDMAHCQPGVLTQANCVLLVVSTYGDGEPPDDAVHFWESVVRGNGLDLRGVHYSVLALGNTTYDQFCKCGRDFDAALERHGACRIYPRVDCDVDYDAPARLWFDGVLSSLRQTDHATISI